MRVCLTGATGYIGLHVLRSLRAAGHGVTAIVRKPQRLGPFADDPGVDAVVADLTDAGGALSALVGHDCLVHAALIWGNPSEDLEFRDTAAAAHLFDAAGRCGIGRCLFLSSTAVHRPFSPEMCEDDPIRTDDIYGATKAAGELALRVASGQHGMVGLVLRAGPVVGPPAFPGAAFRTHGRIDEIVSRAASGNPIDVVYGEGRQFVDVCILADAVVRLLSCDTDESTYICVNRDLITWERIARHATRILGSTSEVRVHGSVALSEQPRFDTRRLQRVMDVPASAERALVEHLRHVVAEIDNPDRDTNSS